MATLTRGITYGSSESITNTKLHTLVDSGTCTAIVNADVSAGAAIAYSKLVLTGSISNSDVNSSAAIAYSKLALTGSVVDADLASGVGTSANNLVKLTAAAKYPAVDGSLITSLTIGSLFGTSASKTVGTIYQAATDGIVCGFVSGGGVNTTMISYSDSNASPSTVVQKGTFTFVGGGPDAFIPVCFPVKKNNYYQVTGGSGGTINFLPLGV